MRFFSADDGSKTSEYTAAGSKSPTIDLCASLLQARLARGGR